MADNILNYNNLIDELQGNTISSLTNFYRNQAKQSQLNTEAQNNQMSPYKFEDYAKQKGYVISSKNNQYSINQMPLDSANVLRLKDGYGSPKLYDAVIDDYKNIVQAKQQNQQIQPTTDENGNLIYTSPYQQQIDDLMGQLNQFKTYVNG